MADIFRPIEPFELTQTFGVNPQNYKQFGLAGHNGWDIRTRYPDTPEGRRYILSSWLSTMYRKGWDPDGYGNFFEVVIQLKNSIWKLTYGHCTSIEDFKTKNEGENMAVSGSTGNSTGPHVHITCKRITIKSDGTHEVINHNNGYFGAVNPQEFFDELRAYKQSGGKPLETGGIMVQVDPDIYGTLVNKSTERDAVRKALEIPDLPLDDKATKIIGAIDGYKNVVTGLQRTVKEQAQEIKNREEQVERIKQSYEVSAKTLTEQLNALNKAAKSFDTERGLLQGQIDTFAKQKGTLSIELERTKTMLAQEQAKSCSSFGVKEAFMLLLKVLSPFRKKGV